LKISVIVATLQRPSLQATLDALHQQTLPRGEDSSEWEILTVTGGPNEYAARNHAAKETRGDLLAFTDDDATPPPDWLEKGLAHFEARPETKVLTGPIEGDMWGQGWMKLEQPGWFVGANMWARRSAFEEVGGFEVDWGLPPPAPRGWRGDTDYGWRMIDRWGEGCYEYAPDVRMVHPKPMQSQWDPRVEERFYLRHRRRCLEMFAPVDPRMDQFVVQQGIEKAPETVEYLNWLVDRFFGRAVPGPGLFYVCPHRDLQFQKLADLRAHIAADHPGSPTDVIEQDGVRWYVPPDAKNYVPLEPHEQNILRWMKRLLDGVPRGILVDVGAERGLYSLTLAPYFERVFAIEPCREYLGSLEKTLELDEGLSSKVLVIDGAAWEREALLEMGRFPTNRGAEWSVREPAPGEERTAVVDGIAIDSLELPGCRLLKVDVEGQGYKVLKGAERTLDRTETVLFEVHDLGGFFEESTKGRELLQQKGYARKAQWFQNGAVHELYSR
jgi:FkbM family methyltransferase